MDKVEYIKVEDGQQIRVVWGEPKRSVFEAPAKRTGPVVMVSEPIPALVGGKLTQVTMVLGRSPGVVYKMAVGNEESDRKLGDVIQAAAMAVKKG